MSTHTSMIAMITIADLGFEIVKRSPCSLDLVPCDFFLFPKLKDQLHGKRLNDDNELKNAINFRIWKLAANGFQVVFDN